MHTVLEKTFGGLSSRYLFRQYMFGLAVAGFVYAMASHRNNSIGLAATMVLLLNTALYPYARFVYESVVEFVMGDNVLFASIGLVLAVKIVTIMVCWCFAVMIAPIGLVYLYVHHNRTGQ
jgi:hypothetical protein